MIDAVLSKIFGTKHEREVKRIQPKIDAINNLEPAMAKLSDAELAAKTVEFRERIANGATLDDLLVEAFAVCREAGKRVLNMRHFDVQLIGGTVLHEGKIAEMRTGEGKTLVATLPCYLNALEGKGVHVITVNDYLAKRDSEWMGRLHKFLGLTVGCITHDISEEDRRTAYACDVTYGTNNEFGFDYLRDNMKFRLESCVQREHNFAIVDEVDSILIDEARTPLIISGPSEESTDKYYRINGIIPKLVRGEVIEGKEPGEKYFTGDYTVDEKQRSVALTEEGVHKVERLLNCGNLYDIENIELNHHVQQGLRAHVLYQRDREYVVQNGEVVIVDEFTGRLMPGRRWSDGLHQAVEAKEGVKIERENQTLATITFQNYFRMYKKLAGMTGTADTEAAEFGKTYKLDVVLIPTNRKMVRKDLNDIVYRTEEEKYRNAAKEIKALHEKGQPVLVGTISVEKSEKLSATLRQLGVRHEVLNAKNHEREAFIIAQAGRKGAVTVSTNMAGRGTDILLGGNPEFLAKDQMRRAGKDPEGAHADEYRELFVKIKQDTDREHDEVAAVGGLFVLGTERHESRRIDNQLRGRAGRQGDPGGSRFYLSLQDDLLRIFGGDKIQGLMLRLGMEEDVPIESGLITKRIEAAQKNVEGNHFSARKHLLEYDDVMNKQRQAVYGMRRAMLAGDDQKARVEEMVANIVGSFIDARLPEGVKIDDYDLAGLQTDVLTQFGVKIDIAALEDTGRELVEQEVVAVLKARYDEKESIVTPELMRETERMILLNVIDNQWKDHLLSMDHLKEGIYLRGYGQKDPLIEYKKESYLLFQDMMARIEDESIRYLYFLQPYDKDGNILTVGPIQVDDDGDYDSGDEGEPVAVAAAPAAVPAAAASITDFTRNIQRKKEKELEALQYVGGDTTTSTNKPQTVVKGQKVGRNELCPCGSGKKYKKCHGA
jgi:preprotein translocase subunit SecA